MIGMLGRTQKVFTRDTDICPRAIAVASANASRIENVRASASIKDHPLIKRISTNDGAQRYEYYTPLDYVYNYIHIYSLVLSKAKQIMEGLFRECHSKGIKMFCTSTDSLYILSKDVKQLEHHIGKEIGKLKIEAQGERACFAGYRLYALGDQKIVLPNRTAKDLTFDRFVQKYYRANSGI